MRDLLLILIMAGIFIAGYFAAVHIGKFMDDAFSLHNEYNGNYITHKKHIRPGCLFKHHHGSGGRNRK